MSDEVLKENSLSLSLNQAKHKPIVDLLLLLREDQEHFGPSSSPRKARPIVRARRKRLDSLCRGEKEMNHFQAIGFALLAEQLSELLMSTGLCLKTLSFISHALKGQQIIRGLLWFLRHFFLRSSAKTLLNLLADQRRFHRRSEKDGTPELLGEFTFALSGAVEDRQISTLSSVELVHQRTRRICEDANRNIVLVDFSDALTHLFFSSNGHRAVRCHGNVQRGDLGLFLSSENCLDPSVDT